MFILEKKTFLHNNHSTKKVTQNFPRIFSFSEKLSFCPELRDYAKQLRFLKKKFKKFISFKPRYSFLITLEVVYCVSK
jgi:hypothetical protein